MTRLEALEKVGNLAVELFRPPYRGHAGIFLDESGKIQDERMAALREALVEAGGFSWEEWT